jgi:hypothetical protein
VPLACTHNRVPFEPNAADIADILGSELRPKP